MRQVENELRRPNDRHFCANQKSSRRTKKNCKKLGAFNEFIEPIAQVASYVIYQLSVKLATIFWHCPAPTGMFCLYIYTYIYLLLQNARGYRRCTHKWKDATVTLGSGTTGNILIFRQKEENFIYDKGFCDFP